MKDKEQQVSVNIDGVVLTGTAEDVMKASEKLGKKVAFHYSQHKGEHILMDEMPLEHLANAILKEYYRWLESLRPAKGKHLDLNALMHDDPFEFGELPELIETYRKKLPQVKAAQNWIEDFKKELVEGIKPKKPLYSEWQKEIPLDYRTK